MGTAESFAGRGRRAEAGFPGRGSKRDSFLFRKAGSCLGTGRRTGSFAGRNRRARLSLRGADTPKQVSLEEDPNGRLLSRHREADGKFCGKKQARSTLVERGGRAEAGFLGRGSERQVPIPARGRRAGNFAGRSRRARPSLRGADAPKQVSLEGDPRGNLPFSKGRFPLG